MVQVVKGEKYSAILLQSSTTRIVPDLVRQLLDPEQIEKVSKTSDINTLKTQLNNKADKRPPFRPPNLSNATPEGLADMLGQVREEMKELKQLEGLYKAALLSKLDVTTEEELPEDFELERSY